jgi:hypothetical protein
MSEIIIDTWEGSGDINEQALVAEGVVGDIVRLNSMAGGHHIDAYFKTQWEQARAFILRSIYFVYNPWVNGLANWQWMKANIPSDCPPRIFPDIEVAYKGYSPSTYAKEVDYFINKCLDSGYLPCDYTGYGFLSLLNPWPKTDYMWARYPYSVMPSISVHTWADLKAKLSAVKFSDADLFGTAHVSPGPVKLWQISGDKWILPGCAGKAIDISIWNGSLDELKAWWGVATSAPVIPTLSDHDMVQLLWADHPLLHPKA